MATEAGLSPWGNDYHDAQPRRGFRARRDSSSRYVQGKGWIASRNKDKLLDRWVKEPRHATKKEIVNPLTGRRQRVNVGFIEDNPTTDPRPLGDPRFVKYMAERNLDQQEAMDAYAADGLSGKLGGETYDEKGCGHIARVKYNTRSQVMQVTFNKRDSRGNVLGEASTVTYFQVPSTAAGELVHLARLGGTSGAAMTNATFDGKWRHLLGVRFWDLVRIRGSRTGGQFPYTYGAGGESAPTVSDVRKAAGVQQEAVRHTESWQDCYDSWTKFANEGAKKNWFKSFFPDKSNPNYGSLPEGEFKKLYEKATGNQKAALAKINTDYHAGRDIDAIVKDLANYRISRPQEQE